MRERGIVFSGLISFILPEFHSSLAVWRKGVRREGLGEGETKESISNACAGEDPTELTVWMKDSKCLWPHLDVSEAPLKSGRTSRIGRDLIICWVLLCISHLFRDTHTHTNKSHLSDESVPWEQRFFAWFVHCCFPNVLHMASAQEIFGKGMNELLQLNMSGNNCEFCSKMKKLSFRDIEEYVRWDSSLGVS